MNQAERGAARLLSIVIVNWNTREFLRAAVKSIRSNPPDGPYEIIVVDNASSDGSAAAVRDMGGPVVLIANSTNTGYARGNNQGIERARGSYILLLNPDVVVSPETLSRAVEFFDSHPRAGALGARQRFPDGRLQPSLRGFPTPWSLACELSGLARIFPKVKRFSGYRMRWFDYSVPIEADQPMGTFLMIRRSVIDAVGMLDEQFPIFFNEVDWCLRCRQAGWQIWFDPAVEITHWGGASTAQVAPQMAWESRRGLLRYFRKHYPGIAYRPVRGAISIASWVHASAAARGRAIVQSESHN